jgi:hypothetical protein
MTSRAKDRNIYLVRFGDYYTEGQLSPYAHLSKASARREVHHLLASPVFCKETQLYSGRHASTGAPTWARIDQFERWRDDPKENPNGLDS